MDKRPVRGVMSEVAELIIYEDKGESFIPSLISLMMSSGSNSSMNSRPDTHSQDLRYLKFSASFLGFKTTFSVS